MSEMAGELNAFKYVFYTNQLQCLLSTYTPNIHLIIKPLLLIPIIKPLTTYTVLGKFWVNNYTARHRKYSYLFVFL